VTSARLNALVGGGVAVLAAALAATALGQGFVNWDDNRFITANPLFAAVGWIYVRAALTRIQFDAYHPLHLLSYLPDRWLWPQNPAGFHAVNLILFALDVFLLFRLARRHACLPAPPSPHCSSRCTRSAWSRSTGSAPARISWRWSFSSAFSCSKMRGIRATAASRRPA
jgi:hypothetical protein